MIMYLLWLLCGLMNKVICACDLILTQDSLQDNFRKSDLITHNQIAHPRVGGYQTSSHVFIHGGAITSTFPIFAHALNGYVQ